MEEIIEIIESDMFYYLFSTVLTIIIGYIVGKGFSFKEIQDIIDAVKESSKDGYISPAEAKMILKEIEDVIGSDWFNRVLKFLKR